VVTEKMRKTKAGVLRQFGKRLSREMEKQSISQAELARRTEISPALIFKYVSGKSQPSGINLLNIAAVLTIHPSMLYSDSLEDIMSKPEIEHADRYLKPHTPGMPHRDPGTLSRDSGDVGPPDTLKKSLAHLIACGLSPTHAFLIYQYESLPFEGKDKVNKLLSYDLNQLALTYQALGDVLSGQAQSAVGQPIREEETSDSEADRRRRRVFASFATLSDEEISVMELIYFEELSTSEAAQYLEIPIQDVEHIWHKAFKKIRRVTRSEVKDRK